MIAPSLLGIDFSFQFENDMMNAYLFLLYFFADHYWILRGRLITAFGPFVIHSILLFCYGSIKLPKGFFASSELKNLWERVLCISAATLQQKINERKKSFLQTLKEQGVFTEYCPKWKQLLTLCRFPLRRKNGKLSLSFFMYECTFIAHYSIHGFRDEYSGRKMKVGNSVFSVELPNMENMTIEF